jgi:hypothetical protein
VHRHSLICGLAITVALCASTASAQSSSTQAPTGEWQVELVPYLWGSGVDGQVGVLNRTADFDASFANILNHLHFAAMGMADVHRDHVIAFTDAIYTDVRGQRATPGPLFSAVNPQQRLFILTPAAGYRFNITSGASIDVIGGIRFWHTRSELEFQPGVLPGVDVEASRGWVDAIGGVRSRVMLPKNWYLNAYGDFGGGGSDFTYQLLATAGIDFHRRFAVSFGYRYLSVDYDKNTFLLDTALKGPIGGFTFKF